MQKITIEPVTRIEGHAKVTIQSGWQRERWKTPFCMSMNCGVLKNLPKGVLFLKCFRSPRGSAGSARSAII